MHFIRHNWFWKIVSLLLAISLWFIVRMQELSSHREFLVPLEIPLPAGQVLVEPPSPPLVRVTVDGPAGRLESIRKKDLRPIIHMEGYKAGQQQRLHVSIEPDPSVDAEGLQINAVPQWVQIRTELRIERQMQLVIDAAGALPEGWDWVRRPEADVSQVTVAGLQSAVNRVARVVAPLRSLSPQEDVFISVPLRSLDRAGRDVLEHVVLEPAQVAVRAQLTRIVWSKQLHVQPIFAAPPGQRLRVMVDPKRVMAYGSSRALQELHFLETVEIDVPAGQLRFAREVRVEIPPGISRIDPPTVRVSVEQLRPGE